MYKIIEVKQSVFEDNNKDANKLREECKDKGVFLLNVMSSPGAGKTTTLSRTLERLKDRMRIGIMEADIDSDVDAKTISEYGVRTIQLHTGGMCHLDADMTRQGLREMGMEDLDLAVLENVGNLVCPAEFDTAIHLTRDIKDGARMVKAEDKMKAILPYAAKRQIKIIRNKKK